MGKSNNPLKKLIAPNLYNHYSSILSLSDIPLFLLDTNGDILLELIPSPNFCTNLCQERKNKVCHDYICQLKNGYEGRFTCKYNLENILCPITVQEETLGYIAGMQVYLKENEYKKQMIDIHSFEKKKHKFRAYR